VEAETLGKSAKLAFVELQIRHRGKTRVGKGNITTSPFYTIKLLTIGVKRTDRI